MELWQQLQRSETDGGQLGATLGEGQLVTRMDQMREAGFFCPTPTRIPNATYQKNYDAVRSLVERAQGGDRRAFYRLQEAMTISDFSNYFGDVLNRSVLANYAETPYSWDQFAYRATLNDTRLAKIFRFDRGASVLDGPITPTTAGLPGGSGSTGLEQLSEYPIRYRTDSKYSDQLYKFGARFGFSFETFLGDDLDALKDTPALLGRAARRTEEKRATQLVFDANGPKSTFFTAGNKNIVTSAVNPIVTTNNPVLSVTSLAWALIILSSQLDQDGEPISVEGATLVVGPALKYTAMNIVRTSQIAMNDQGGTLTGNNSAQRLFAPNPFQGVVNVAINYYLPVVATTNGNTSWAVFADPKNGRPACQLSFLRGREAPQIFMRSSNQVQVGEGRMGPGGAVTGGSNEVNPMEGDFENDAIYYKERHFLGGTTLDPIMAVASNGSGS